MSDFKKLSEEKKEYVIIDVQPMIAQNEYMVLLVQKNKPEWQKGYLNLIGGVVEPGETPFNAAIRELKEESGYEPYCPDGDPVQWMGTIECDDCRVHCYKVVVDIYSQPEPMPREGETEIVRWYPWRLVRKDKRLVPSLRVVLPMMMAGVYDWKLYVFESLMGRDFQYVEMKVPSELHDQYRENEFVTKILNG
jgi:8-oxo-dGTP pyrophosphatase MutT (NUDIX family)